MARFEQGNTFSTGRKKGSRNKLTNDVRAAFHKAYDEMGNNKVGKDGKPMTGHEAFLAWARDNQTEFYRLYAKMIPKTAEFPDDLHEHFVDTLVFEEEQVKMIEGNAKVVDVTDTKPK
ncbi:hypothetical protein SCALIN_C16_0007 [Candidatus Scalindua japonica]|uniref:Uncharacterized protein n=1 Tax=Candidatus Scalindua japonica TaxID=1284222 RepID=A0A286TYF4_9BACT|nr:hypothetical protein [Candidatus Scalindua japonica]GAX60933.1 hypothetical protein SCALIN_C16_0007 [Candidatus Scalindua japonica]